MLDRLFSHVRMLIEQGRENEKTIWMKEIAKEMGQLKAAAAALGLLKLPECPETNRYQREMRRNLEAVTRWMDENAAMMNCKGQKTKQQDPAAGTALGSRPCRLKDKGCPENHQLDRCGVFRRLTAEQKLAVLQEKRMCIFCYKHQSNRDCFALSLIHI